MRDAYPKPRLGIFWWFQNRLITDTTALADAEPYGDVLTHPTGHIDYWTSVQVHGAIPSDLEYDGVSRGRVGYNVKTRTFLMFADRCIIDHALAVKEIIAALGLPENTEPQPDSHYKCPECSAGRRK